MLKFKTYKQFILEQEDSNDGDDLFKVYLITGLNPESDDQFTYKGFATDNFFTDLNEDTNNINQSYPILNYNNALTLLLIDEGKINPDNVYNLPQHTKDSSSKEKFHKLIGEDENIPNTVYTQAAAYNLNFPVIGKPSKGHSGTGIKVFKNVDELKESDPSKFNVYSEYKNKLEEHRFVLFNGEPILWMERKPLNERAKTGTGDASQQMEFQYIKRNVGKIPEEYSKVLDKYGKKMDNIPFICFDMMKDNADRVYVIESNTQPGLPFDSTVKAYKSIFEDYYGRPINDDTIEILNKCSEQLNKETLNQEGNRFIDESKTETHEV